MTTTDACTHIKAHITDTTCWQCGSPITPLVPAACGAVFQAIMRAVPTTEDLVCDKAAHHPGLHHDQVRDPDGAEQWPSPLRPMLADREQCEQPDCHNFGGLVEVCGTGPLFDDPAVIPMAVGYCLHQYERPGGRRHGDRVVECRQWAGHPDDHEEADTGFTWPAQS